MFCKHKWVVLSETTTKSSFELAIEFGRGGKIPHQMCSTKRKHIVIVTCSLCGKTKKYVEKI